RWFSLLFNKKKALKDVINTQVSEEHYRMIDKWKEIYSGYHKEWHDVKYHSIGKGYQTRRMHTLNMGKVVSEELSKMLYTEKVDINIDNESFKEHIHDVLKQNRFDKVFQSKLEVMFALGGLILKAHPKEQPDGSYKLQIN